MPTAAVVVGGLRTAASTRNTRGETRKDNKIAIQIVLRCIVQPQMYFLKQILNQKASRFIGANANVKGKPNLTVSQFCQWVNCRMRPLSMDIHATFHPRNGCITLDLK